MRLISSRVLLRTTLALLVIAAAVAARPAVGQDEQPSTKPAAAKQAKKFRGRLPNYYRSVVDQKQRETIYKVQEEYAAKIDALKAQLEAITKERDEKVRAVLTPEQQKKVEDIATAAKAQRERKKSAKEKPAAEAPADK